MDKQPLSTDEVFQAAFDLPPDDRMHLAHCLMEYLPTPDTEEVEQAWIAEVRRRLQTIKDGTAKLIPAEEVFRKLRSRSNG